MAMYSAVFSGVSVSAQQDLFSLASPSGSPVCIHGCVLSQTTAVGDANERDLLLQVKRGATTVGSGGSSVTPTDLGTAGLAYGGTVRANDTTQAAGGSVATLHSEGWNIRSTWPWIPTPECRIWVPAAGRLVVSLASTPAAAYTMTGTLYFEAV